MKKKAIALIPLVARKKRRKQAKKGAKAGGPALFAAAAGFVVVVLRRRKRSTPEPQYTQAEAQDAAPARSEAARQDSETQVLDAITDSGTSAAGGDTLGSAPVAPTTDLQDDDVVIPDTGAEDPLVREQTNAAAAEAGAIGGSAAAPTGDLEGIPDDPAMRPVEESSGESFEGFEERDEDLGSRRETGG
jgi:hypothetical protein